MSIEIPRKITYYRTKFITEWKYITGLPLWGDVLSWFHETCQSICGVNHDPLLQLWPLIIINPSFRHPEHFYRFKTMSKEIINSEYDVSAVSSFFNQTEALITKASRLTGLCWCRLFRDPLGGNKARLRLSSLHEIRRTGKHPTS